jgi:DNA-binding NtrC family response regulator
MSPAVHTVLLVDDEPSIVAALRRTLRPTQVRVLTAGDGVEALSILDREIVDVLISDIDMPTMSGLELATRARAEHPDVVRVLVTGRGSLDTALAAINQGEVFRFLTKPWNDVQVREVVTDAIARLAEMRRAAAATRAAESRRRLMEELEREHPGITSRPVGDYVIDRGRVEALRARIQNPALLALLA